MFRWLPYAFVRITLFFISGILFEIYFPDTFRGRVIIGAFAFLLPTCSAIFILQRVLKKQFIITGIFVSMILFVSGCLLVHVRTAKNDRDHFIFRTDSIRYYRAKISRQPELKARSWRMEASVIDIRTDKWRTAKGNVILYYPREDSLASWKFGDVLLVKGAPSEVRAPANPYEFDYRRFLFFRNIYHQHFLRPGNVMHLENTASGPLKYSIIAREWADDVLKKSISGAREQSIASALVLGVSGGLDHELLGAYAATGTTHILSVSGLHVSIIYMLLLLMLSPFAKTYAGKWMLAVISIVALWAYAFITGLSPSVLRAVTMFTCMALARPWKRSASIYNTLAVSAFVLLCYDPFLIMSVGFQLSYLAVLGIVYLQPRIYAWLDCKNRITDECWKMTSVSIAAQVATLPVTLFYFHQFPTYFLLANLVIIPASSAVLILGIATIAFGIFPKVAWVIGWVIDVIIEIMNHVVFVMESFPGSLVDNIFLTPLQAWSLAAMMLLTIGLFHFRRFSFAVGVLLFSISFSINQWLYMLEEMAQEKLVVYSVPGHSAVDLIYHAEAISFLDSALQASPQAIKYQIQPTRIANGVDDVRAGGDNISRSFAGCRLIRWRGKTILQVISPDFHPPPSVNVDFLIISNNALRCSSAITAITSAPVILDSSNSVYFVKAFRAKAGEDAVPVYSVLQQGAFVFRN